MDIYISGTSFTYGIPQAAYLKNGNIVRFNEHDNTHSHANSVVARKNNIYLSGDYNGHPCYWTNGNRTMLNDNNQGGTVTGMRMSSDYTFLIGNIKTNLGEQAVIWKLDGSRYFLSNLKSTATSADNNNVNISGYVYENNIKKACYWEVSKYDQTPVIAEHILDVAEHAGGISSTESAGFFIAGSQKDNSNIEHAGYWNNGTFSLLQNDGNPSRANDVYVKSDLLNPTQYFVGTHNSSAAFWINNKLTLLSQNSNSAALKLYFHNGAEYILGYDTVNGVKSFCYWQGVMKNELFTTDFEPNSMDFVDNVEILQQ